MGPYVWCAIGAVLGWLFTLMATDSDFILRVEAIGVGVFSAFIGGEFVAPMLLPPAVKGEGLPMPAIALAVAGAVLGLFLLAWMRKAVGPLKRGKKRTRPT